MDRAYRMRASIGWSREPIIEMLIPSTLDDSLAPAGRHVASLFCQHTAPTSQAVGTSIATKVADLMIATVDRYAPGFKASVLGPASAVAARSGEYLRPHRRRYFPWPACRSISCFRRAPCSAMAIIVRRLPGSICAARARIPAAASPAHPATMLRARCCAMRAKGPSDRILSGSRSIWKSRSKMAISQ